jgi:predicted negative regulator of RcsB-dependent stress response
MRRLLTLVLLLVVVIGAIGWWRGWFTFNQDKFNQDEQTAKQKLNELNDNLHKKDTSPVIPK